MLPRAAMRRALCTVAKTATAEAPAAEGPSRRLVASGAAVAVGATASAAAYFTTRRFVHEPEFRAGMRSNWVYLAGVVEGTLLPEYAPAEWSKHLRIQDDLGTAEEPSDLILMCDNPGASIVKPQVWSEVGHGYWRRFRETDGTSDPLPSRAASTPTSAPSLYSSKVPAAAPTESLDPIAPDDVDDADKRPAVWAVGGSAASVVGASAALALDAAGQLLDEHGGPDGAHWGSSVEQELLTSWSSSTPPEAAVRLLVPEGAARRYEEALAAYAALKEAHEAGVEDLSATSVMPARAVSGKRANGQCYIALPEDMRDGSFADGALAGSSAELRVAWLRAVQTYAEAEAAALDETMPIVDKRVRMGEGGGTALRRMRERKQRLDNRIADLEMAKKEQNGRGALAEQGAPASSTSAADGGKPLEPLANFVAAERFQGAKKMYVFKRGEQGLGYYLDYTRA